MRISKLYVASPCGVVVSAACLSYACGPFETTKTIISVQELQTEGSLRDARRWNDTLVKVNISLFCLGACNGLFLKEKLALKLSDYNNETCLKINVLFQLYLSLTAHTSCCVWFTTKWLLYFGNRMLHIYRIIGSCSDYCNMRC